MRTGAILLGLLAVTAVVLLVTHGASGKAGGRVESRDGMLTVVEPTRLVLQPTTGGGPVTFAMHPIDARRMNLLHLQAHRDQGLASRVSYQREGGTLYALRVVDLPSGP